jgi:uncharacterized OB-fold protein
VPLLADLAELHPGVHTEAFWAACAQRALAFQRCTACGRFQHPPLPGCRHCGSRALAWSRVAGRGRIFSVTIVHHPAFPALRDAVPYNVVTVEFDDAPGVRLVSNVLDAPDGLAIGQAVDLAWDEPRPGVVLPRFRVASRGSAG